jgi:hypothetical protein
MDTVKMKGTGKLLCIDDIESDAVVVMGLRTAVQDLVDSKLLSSLAVPL